MSCRVEIVSPFIAFGAVYSYQIYPFSLFLHSSLFYFSLQEANFNTRLSFCFSLSTLTSTMYYPSQQQQQQQPGSMPPTSSQSTTMPRHSSPTPPPGAPPLMALYPKSAQSIVNTVPPTDTLQHDNRISQKRPRKDRACKQYTLVLKSPFTDELMAI